ncbi:hypothetical protein GCM10010346_64600 [Streptomyces chryseus]|uniref:Uncharacterized protein n=1 Tax=Streptomyces chryseus TaxID=68186 RepID=A0ABQ3EEL5_9ACTN|nr:hypothetical protein GCM10010346_64600 [Streptomyces chryseus]
MAVLYVQGQAHPCAVVPRDITALHAKSVDGDYWALLPAHAGMVSPRHRPQHCGESFWYQDGLLSGTVDAEATVPVGTASNDFAGRDDLFLRPATGFTSDSSR